MTAPAPAPEATAVCTPYIGAKRLRVTRLDACGRPVYGPSSQVVTKGFVSVEMEPEVAEGEDYSQVTAGGEQCISEKGQDSIKWWTVKVTFCQVDPDLFTIMNRTWRPVTNAARTQRTGWRMGQAFSDSLGFALELWPKSAGGAGQACDPDSGIIDETFDLSGYFLLPWVLGGAPETITLENAPTTFTITGRTRSGSLWGRGPYNVTRDQDGQPAPLLDPIDPGFNVGSWGLVSGGDPDHFHGENVTVTPPEPMCGAQPLYAPGATAPQITVVAGTTARSAELTVGNFDQIGSSGTVNWGDGTIAPVPSSSNGTAQHTYAASQDGIEQIVTFTPGNGAEPVSTAFTPTGG